VTNLIRALGVSAVVLASVMLAAHPADEKRPVTFDDIMTMKVPGSPAISPDGASVVYTVRQWETAPGRDGDAGGATGRREARTHLWRVAVDGATPTSQFTFSDRSETSPAWSPDGAFVSFLSTRGGAAAGEEPPKQQIWLIPAAGGEAWKLTDAAESITAYAWSPDSKRIAYAMRDPLSKEDDAKRKRRDDPDVFEDDFRYSHVWIVDVAGKKAERLTEGDSFTVTGTPSWSSDGARIAFTGTRTPMTRDGRADVYVAAITGKTVEKVSTNAGPDRSPVWSPDGRTIAWIATPNPQPMTPDGTYPAPVAHGRVALYDVVSKHTREAGAGFDGAPDDLTWSPDSSRLYFGAGVRMYREAFALEVATGKVAQLTRGQTIGLANFTRDGQRAVFTKDSPVDPLEIYVADARFAAPKRLTTTNPQAAAFALGEAEVITWKSDGHEIEGVLLKPVGFQPGKRYPLLTVIHGGPAGAHTNGYRVAPGDGGQAWAGEGWAVLYPNPRGSSNYGEKFMRANLNDWGGGDYRDIMAGVDAAIARGVADPHKLAVLGWSYGGYMTCWVVSQTGRFKAAMIGAGLTNMVSMHGTNDIPNTTWTYFGGPPSKQTLQLFTARSGIAFADNVTTPTLTLHGANDQRVPIGQPMEFYRALKDRGKTVELVFYPREGHGLTEYYHQLDRLKRQRDWIVKYTLGGDGRKTITQ
jgi:dipeptidyl aminopeptidase/acylaminoacyl peptidase